jgi:hypothetical protein
MQPQGPKDGGRTGPYPTVTEIVMGSGEALRLREQAALMRRVAVIRTHGDAEIDRELLRLAASLEDWRTL